MAILTNEQPIKLMGELEPGMNIAAKNFLALWSQSKVAYWLAGFIGLISAFTGLTEAVVYGAATILVLDFISGIMVSFKESNFKTDANHLGRSFYKVFGYGLAAGLIFALGAGEQSLIGTAVMAKIGFPGLAAIIYAKDGASIAENIIKLVGKDRFPDFLQDFVSRFAVANKQKDKAKANN